METIKRYNMETEYNKYACADVVKPISSDDGEWVRYADLRAALTKAQAAPGGVVDDRAAFDEWARSTAEFVTLNGAEQNGKPWRYFDHEAQDAWVVWQAAVARRAGSAEPVLTVWEGSMPESNGKSNFTAVLHRKNDKGFDMFTDGFTIARSEYPDRVRYEADCVRYIIGELPEKPWILDYDADKHSGYVAPIAAPQPLPALTDEQIGEIADNYKFKEHYRSNAEAIRFARAILAAAGAAPGSKEG